MPVFKKGDRVKCDVSAFVDISGMRPFGHILTVANDKGSFMVRLDYPIRWEEGDLSSIVWLKEYELAYVQPAEEAERLTGQPTEGASPFDGPDSDKVLEELTDALTREASPLVDHPAHYTTDPSGVECIQVTRHRNFNVGNAIKYLWRAGKKDGNATIQDLHKAIWYIRDEIDRLADNEKEGRNEN